MLLVPIPARDEEYDSTVYYRTNGGSRSNTGKLDLAVNIHVFIYGTASFRSSHVNAIEGWNGCVSVASWKRNPRRDG